MKWRRSQCRKWYLSICCFMYKFNRFAHIYICSCIGVNTYDGKVLVSLNGLVWLIWLNRIPMFENTLEFATLLFTARQLCDFWMSRIQYFLVNRWLSLVHQFISGSFLRWFFLMPVTSLLKNWFHFYLRGHSKPKLEPVLIIRIAKCQCCLSVVLRPLTCLWCISYPTNL